VPTATTPRLEIAYEERNPGASGTVVLVHGFPDDVRTWDPVLRLPAFAPHRTIAPWLRGFGATRFLDPASPRTAGTGALARDIIDLLDALDIERCTLVGHDWGARAAYAAAILAPERIERLIAIAVAYATNVPGQILDYDQAHAYWYQWFFTTPRGEAALTSDRHELCRYLWRTWSPSWQFDDAEFERTAAAFDNPDFVPIVLHSYRRRWGFAAADPRDAEDDARLANDPPISVPTVVLHGDEDGATLLSATAGKERYFTGGYARILVRGAGHFVQREAPAAVAAAFEQT
jgi:pimeloyl-ACP methyl ester carboxylesterase